MMVIFVSEKLIHAIHQLEVAELYRTKNPNLTFSWTYGQEGNSADGIVYDEQEKPIKQFDVATPNTGEVWVLERNIYSDFEISWNTYDLNNSI